MDITTITTTRPDKRRIPDNPSKQELLRQRLPYGIWECEGGYSVLFNRRYWPLRVKTPEGRILPIDPDCWIKFTKQSWFYKDGNAPAVNATTKARCESILAEWSLS